mgnify:CR=1 FL=1
MLETEEPIAGLSVSRDGRRCTATAFLELDHIEPRALEDEMRTAYLEEGIRTVCIVPLRSRGRP